MEKDLSAWLDIYCQIASDIVFLPLFCRDSRHKDGDSGPGERAITLFDVWGCSGPCQEGVENIPSEKQVNKKSQVDSSTVSALNRMNTKGGRER
jgi:hypothetical protein